MGGVTRKLVERNAELVKRVLRYLLDEPRVLSALPDEFEVVVLPESDPELRAYNLELLDKYRTSGKPVVLVRIGKGGKESAKELLPVEVYVPLAA